MADRIEDGGAAAGRDLVAELTSLAELDTLGGFWATADIHGRAADKLAEQAAEITRLRAENAGMLEALERIAHIHHHNYGRQDEKLADVEPIARAAAARARQIGLSVGSAEHG